MWPAYRWLVVGTVCVGAFLGQLDASIAGLVLPTLQQVFAAPIDSVEWVSIAYLLTLAALVVPLGRLADLLGRKMLYSWGFVVFIAGSALCGVAPTLAWLITFRVVQAVGAAMLQANSVAIITAAVPRRALGRAIGVQGAAQAVGLSIGPSVGGLLIDTLGWQWVFFVNLPVGAVVFAVIWRALPRGRPSAEAPRIDYLGATVLVAALVPILVGLTNKQSASWGDPSVGGLIALGLVIAAVFVWIESRAIDPIVPLELFRNRSFTISVIAMFVASMAFFAPIVFLPRWFQVVGGASATQSGYQILALLGGLILSAILSGQLVARTGRYKPLALGASVVLAIGLFLLSNLRADTPLPLLWSWMFVTGIGVGPIFSVFTLVVQGAVPLRQIGTATSNLTLFQQVGGSVGLAAAGTVFGSRLVEELPRQLAASSLPPQIVASFSASGAGSLNRLTGVGDLGQAILAGAPVTTRAQLEPFVPDIVGAIHRAFSLATASTFDFGIVAALVAVVMVVFLREAPMRGPVREEATAAPPSPDRQPSPLAGEAGK